MAFRQKSKHLQKLEARFMAQVTAYLAKLGTRPGRLYEVELDTPAGVLHISIHDNWIACRFEDVALGRQFTAACGRACNPYSGKWNFHYAADQSFDPEQPLAGFRYYLDRLLNWQTAAA